MERSGGGNGGGYYRGRGRGRGGGRGGGGGGGGGGFNRGGRRGGQDHQHWRSTGGGQPQGAFGDRGNYYQDQQHWRSPGGGDGEGGGRGGGGGGEGGGRGGNWGFRRGGWGPPDSNNNNNNNNRGGRSSSWVGSTGGSTLTPTPNPTPSSSSSRSSSIPAPISSESHLAYGIQSLTVSQRVTSPSSPTGANEKATPVKRPDNGGMLCVRSIRLRVNHFLVSFNPESIIRHYDVDVKPKVLPKHGHLPKISKSTLAMIRNKLFSEDPDRFPLAMTVYDGEKNIFSPVSLPTGKFEVNFAEAEDMTSRTYMFTIKLVRELKLCKLEDYLRGNLFAIPRDILQGMDIVMKENPTRCMIPVGRSFHPFDTSPELYLRRGIIASKGFQHSLRPSVQGLALCLDYSVLAFRQRLPVLDFLQEHIWGFRISEFRRFRRDVENALKGLKVTVTHRITKQKYVINRLTRENTENLTFDVENPDGRGPARRVSVVDYFRQKYRKDIANRFIPCLDLGKNNRINYVPMEFCVLVEGQVFPKENLDRNAARFLKDLSLAKPVDRQRTIIEMVRSENGPCGGNIIQNFGIQVNTEMTSVVGRVIGPPELKLGTSPPGRVMRLAVDRQKCQWNLVGKGVVEGKSLERWAILDFSASDNEFRLYPKQFIPKLIARCRSLGMHMEEPIFYEPSTMSKFESSDILLELLEGVNDKAHKTNKGQLQLILCVMSDKHHGYKYLKLVSETRVGVLTQCCLSTHANEGKDQYLANLALKINAKLGGSNAELNDRLPYFEGEDHVMFVGADVNHPASRNTTSPSIAAVVATINWPGANRYAARVCPQDHRSEKILNFGRMCFELVETYSRLNNVRPGKIVLFRDGVSEGQFDMVLNEELVDLKRVFKSANYAPTITVIVAQKRHQTRLFPENERDGGSTGNVPPGTVVDTRIVHPFEFDFFLCSHYGSLGTSKPTHYHVLWDEHGFNSDQLQKLIYNLCFTFARCTKPVSLVPPVYYADLAAYRGRLYYEAVVEGQSPPSGASSSSTLTSSSLSSSPSLDEKFYKLHAALENNMFFI